MESTMKNFSDNSSQSHHFAEVSLRYSPSADMALRPKLHAPNDVFEYLLKLWDLDTIEISETFYVLLFNNKNRLLGWSQISKGSRSATVVDVGHIVTLALLGNASHLVIAHNHPSGELRPSRADIRITGRLVEALGLHDIRLNDHLIINRQEYYSFAEQGLVHAQHESP